tara:strand:- start:2197 stop:3153 length:957 start_codon:yes stop_codon:yes gene_type:complete
MKILITGVAGFIGFSCAKYFLEKKFIIYGLDNFENYYNVKLKKLRIKELKKNKNFKFYKIDISDKKQVIKINSINFDYVFHFAAQPGVRYSLINPKKYYKNNVLGYANLISIIKKKNIKKIIYASSSSVYGDQKKFPTKENSKLNSKNPYGTTKVITEELSKIFCKYNKAKFIGLRFFTVYGEWGRPDMFIFKLLNSIYKKKKFVLNNAGDHYRDFTYIMDIVKICYKLINYRSAKKHEIFNVCAGNSVNILKLSKDIQLLSKKAQIKNVPANKADVYETHGSNAKIKKSLNISKFTNINVGLRKTIIWYLDTYKKFS